MPTALVCEVTVGDTDCDLATVQSTLLRAIAALAPSADAPDTARVRRTHDVLRYRFVHELTQEETAERLGIASRSVRREERIAGHQLARYLWERHTAGTPAGIPRPEDSHSPDSARSDPSEWRGRLLEELAALRAGNAEEIADARSTVTEVVSLEATLAERCDKTLSTELPTEPCPVGIPPAALRTLLVMAVSMLCRRGQAGTVSITIERREAQTCIGLSGPAGETEVDSDRLEEMVRILGGTVLSSVSGKRARLELMLPNRPPINVVVIDDNADFVGFCRRCAVGTPYRIVTPDRYDRDAVKALDPDVVLLDIMLPGVDGWELLRQLREDMATAEIPVAVCSIVPEEDLALLMGATAYLPKPVQHRELVDTLSLLVA